MKRRSAIAAAALGRKASTMKHRNAGRGGSSNEYRDLMDVLMDEHDLIQPYEDSDTFEEPWVVTSWNETTLIGVVSNGKEVFTFHSTSFAASTFRWPRTGETVEVVKNLKGHLLSVHGK